MGRPRRPPPGSHAPRERPLQARSALCLPGTLLAKLQHITSSVWREKILAWGGKVNCHSRRVQILDKNFGEGGCIPVKQEHRFAYAGGAPPTRPWFKYWPRGLPRQLDYPLVSIFDIIEKNALRFPDKAAVIFYGRAITYQELYQSAINLAGYLSKLINKGSRVAVCIGNAPHWHVCAFGVLRANAVLTSVNPLLSADEIEYVLKDSGAEVVICLSDRVDDIFSVLGRTNVRHVICGHWKDYLPDEPQPEPPEGILTAPPIPEQDVIPWSEVVSQRQQPPEPVSGVDDPALIIYTSGTTGVPKGVVHTYRSMWPSILGSIAWNNRVSSEVNFSTVAVFHVTGMVHNIYAAHEIGASVVLMARWDPRRAAEMIHKYRPTFWMNIPTVVTDLLNLPDLERYDLSSLLVSAGGGAPMPEAVAEKLRALTGIDYTEVYGYTESFSQTHWVPHHRVKFGCVGVPHFGADALIIEPETGKLLSPGEQGEIVVHAPNIFLEYWNKPEETREAFIEIEGKKYFRSGDLGYMDEDGYFYITDRVKRMINRAGYKVWPAALENKMYAHPAVAGVCVVATPDPRVGEEVKAYVVPSAEVQKKVEQGALRLDDVANELRDWCKQRMAAYEYPRIIEFINELPKTASGKILWRVLQDREKERAKS